MTLKKAVAFFALVLSLNLSNIYLVYLFYKLYLHVLLIIHCVDLVKLFNLVFVRDQRAEIGRII